MEERYKLHLTQEQLDELENILDNYDHLCDCPKFPNCKDFKAYKKLKNRVHTLAARSVSSRWIGRMSMRKRNRKYVKDGIIFSAEVRSKKGGVA